MSERTVTIPQQLYKELTELKRVDETLPNLIARLLDHYKDTTEKMNKLLHVLKDDSVEWKQLEQRINKKLSMNDAAIIYQWRLTCKKIAESTPKSEETEQDAPPKS